MLTGNRLKKITTETFGLNLPIKLQRHRSFKLSLRSKLMSLSIHHYLCFIATMKNNLTCLSRVKLLKRAVLLSIDKLNYYFGEPVATRPDHMQTSTCKSAVCMQPCEHHLFSEIINAYYSS